MEPPGKSTAGTHAGRRTAPRVTPSPTPHVPVPVGPVGGTSRAPRWFLCFSPVWLALRALVPHTPHGLGLPLATPAVPSPGISKALSAGPTSDSCSLA